MQSVTLETGKASYVLSSSTSLVCADLCVAIVGH